MICYLSNAGYFLNTEENGPKSPFCVDMIPPVLQEGETARYLRTWMGNDLVETWLIRQGKPQDVLVSKPPITKITSRAFMRRFSKKDRILLRNSRNDDVIDLMDDLKMSTYVDLSDSTVLAGIDATFTNVPGLETSQEAIKASGTKAEMYSARH